MLAGASMLGVPENVSLADHETLHDVADWMAARCARVSCLS